MAEGLMPFSHMDAQGNFVAPGMVHKALGPYGVVAVTA